MEMGLRRKPKTESVWESRMKSDEFKGGIKVFEEDDDDEISNNDDDDCNKSTIDEVQVVDDSKKVNLNTRSPFKHNVVVGTMTNGNGVGKRKTWKSEGLGGGNSIQVAAPKQRSDMVKKSPIHNRKTRSAAAVKEKEKEVVEDSNNPIQNKKTRSQSVMPPTPTTPESGKSRSESVQASDEKAKNIPQSSNKHSEEKDISSNEVKSPPPKDADGDEEPEAEKKSLVVKEISNVEEHNASKNNVLEVVKEKNSQTQKSSNLRKPTVPVPPIVKKQSLSFQSNQSKLHFTSLPSKSKPSTNDIHRNPTKHSKMQSIVELVMWRDVSRTAFVFGIGTFFIISSSYTKDLNISLISVISYVGLLYLAAIFLFRSFISRGNEMNDSSMEYVFGEEDAIRLVKSTLPYVNECLLNLKALFSGDPATTIKMAMMLYVLARCGSSITIWKMTKLSFFGVFTIPKICSSYSKHLTNYGVIWIGQIREGWESCSHKKAVGFAIFTIFWNLSSYIARIWAVFVLFVAFRFYHQQSMVEEEEEGARCEYPSQPDPTQRKHTRPIPVVAGGKQKKIY